MQQAAGRYGRPGLPEWPESPDRRLRDRDDGDVTSTQRSAETARVSATTHHSIHTYAGIMYPGMHIDAMMVGWILNLVFCLVLDQLGTQ